MSSQDPTDSRSALQEPLFRRYFIVACQSAMGTWITRFLIGWLAWDHTHSALWVGITSACMLFPAIFLSPVFGVLSDRINPRNGMLATLGSQSVVAAIAAMAMASGRFSLSWLIVLALAIGVISAAHHPLRLALIPQMVSRAGLPGAIGLSAVVFNLSRILGPALAGVLLTHTSTTIAFLLSTILFLGGFCALLRVGINKRPATTPHAGLLTELLEGLHFATVNPTIRFVLGLTLINGLLGRAVIELLPAISGKLLDGDATTLAVLTASAGTGSILGGLLLTRQRDNESILARLVLINLSGTACALLPINWTDHIWLLTPIIGYLSLATTMAGIGSQALAQFAVQEEFRGRVMSLWTMLSMGAPALGGFVMGALADSVGFGLTLIGFATLALMAIGGLWRRLSALTLSR